MRGFFQMYFDALPFVKAQSRAIFGIDAPAYRETQSFWGWSPDTDLLKPQVHPAIQFNFSNNLEVCLLMDWYWRASGDEAFLRDEFYPLLKEIISFYLQYAKKGDDGKSRGDRSGWIRRPSSCGALKTRGTIAPGNSSTTRGG